MRLDGITPDRLGIDPMTATIVDQAGRPQFLIDHREPIRELL